MAIWYKVPSLAQGIPKFDGNPLKYEDWKSVTIAVLATSRNDMLEILVGDWTLPQPVYSKLTRRQGIAKAQVLSVEAAAGDSSNAVHSSPVTALDIGDLCSLQEKSAEN